jgi:hypothetical protein
MSKATCATPEPTSPAVAASETTVPRRTEPPGVAVKLTVGAAVSTWISCERACSALPALSVEKYLTVVVWSTVKGAV